MSRWDAVGEEEQRADCPRARRCLDLTKGDAQAVPQIGSAFRLQALLKGVAVLSALASAAAFAPIATVPRTQRTGPSMQLYKDGKLQGQGVNCIPIFPRPAYLDGTIPGDMGFDPMGIGSWDVLNMNFLREAEIKHGRLAMLAFVGIMVEGAGIKFPGVAATLGNSNDIFEIHNAAVAKGSMGQILLWTGLFETLCGLPAMWQRMDGSGTPGDFGFDPLGLGKKNMARKQLVEIKNGRLAMLAVSGTIHHKLLGAAM